MSILPLLSFKLSTVQYSVALQDKIDYLIIYNRPDQNLKLDDTIFIINHDTGEHIEKHISQITKFNDFNELYAAGTDLSLIEHDLIGMPVGVVSRLGISRLKIESCVLKF